MNCHETEQLFNGLLDNELSRIKYLRINEHLEHCSSCRQLFHQYSMIHSQLSELSSEMEPGRDLWYGIQNRIISKKRPHGLFRAH